MQTTPADPRFLQEKRFAPRICEWRKGHVLLLFFIFHICLWNPLNQCYLFSNYSCSSFVGKINLIPQPINLAAGCFGKVSTHCWSSKFHIKTSNIHHLNGALGSPHPQIILLFTRLSQNSQYLIRYCGLCLWPVLCVLYYIYNFQGPNLFAG